MMRYEICKIEETGITFVSDQGNTVTMWSHHDTCCCEHHWVQWDAIEMSDVEDLAFEITPELKFIKKVPDYGIELIPINGHPVRFPGYGANNGYYSDNLELIVDFNGFDRQEKLDITECQSWQCD